MKRLIAGVAKTYLLLAIVGHFMERNGVLQCACEPDCWCKRPGLNLFRWVFPYGHHLRDARTEPLRD
jgi:hypothetical protein